MDPLKDLRLMLAFFGEGRMPRAQAVSVDAVPAAPRALLAHGGHMTEVLERHHGAAVAVHPYRIERHGDIYGRMLDLSVAGGGIVMTGLMIFNLRCVTDAVRAEIVAARTPLGRILISHGVLRAVQWEALLRFEAHDPIAARFGHAGGQPCWGRLATIVCDGLPAVDLLEVVAPSD